LLVRRQLEEKLAFPVELFNLQSRVLRFIFYVQPRIKVSMTHLSLTGFFKFRKELER
jgi:hypothetical protein